MTQCVECQGNMRGNACTACGWMTPPKVERNPQPSRGPTPALTADQRAQGERVLAEIKAKLKAPRPPRADAMPHVLSGVALRGIDMDPEAIAEREAIQNEGKL